MSQQARYSTLAIAAALATLGILAPARADPPRGRFLTPSRITGPVDVGDGGPATLSGDERTMVFSSIREGSPEYLGHDVGNGGDLYLAWREHPRDQFLNVVHLGAEINSPTDELGAGLSADGLVLVYSTRRNGSTELWTANRAAQFAGDGQPLPFENPKLLEPGLVAAGHFCWNAHFSDDDSKLYLTSYRLETGTSDLLVVDVDRDELGIEIDLDTLEPVCGEDVNTSANENSSSLAAGGRALFFSETVTPFRPGTRGNTDIWFAWRDDADDCFDAVVNLNDLFGTTINTTQGEWAPYVSRDWPAAGSRIYFSLWRNIFVAEWIPEVPPRLYVRGDANDDGTVDISDPQFILSWLFLGARAPSCELSCDLNDDEKIDLSDAVYGLNALFTGGAPIPAPHPDCGPVVVSPLIPNALGCDEFTSCDEAD